MIWAGIFLLLLFALLGSGVWGEGFLEYLLRQWRKRKNRH